MYVIAKQKRYHRLLLIAKVGSATLPSITSDDTVVTTVPTNMEKLLE